MSIFDIKAGSSVVFSNKSKCGVSEGNIYIGSSESCLFWSYIYFDLSELPAPIEIISANIVLYKVPVKESMSKKEKNDYYLVAPCLDFVSKYSYVYSDIKVDEKCLVRFRNTIKECFIEVDVTRIVMLWMSNIIENKGLLLYPHCESKMLSLGGLNNCDGGLKPFLRIKYRCKDGICPPSNQPVIRFPITVKISKDS